MATSIIERLVARREEAGLTQADVAARMATSQPVIARLEAGARDPRLSTLERYARVVGADLELRQATPPVPGSAVRVSERIHDRLSLGTEPATATFRELIQFLDDAKGLDGGELRAVVRHEPLSTGDRRWDALVAAAVDWLSSARDIDPPRWTGSSRLRLSPPGWVLSPHQRLHALIREATPIEFSRHGVYVDRASLTSA